jgi:anti-anti-sigma regulatory factor
VLERGHRRLVIDLRGTTFFDCASLATLTRAVAPLEAHSDGAVVVAGATGIVQRFLSLVAVERLLPLARTRHEAIEVLRSPSPG